MAQGVEPSYLIDTNVLVYLHDTSEPEKRAACHSVVERLVMQSAACLPAQALGEFANVALKKFVPPLPIASIRRMVEGFRDVFNVLPLTSSVVLEALRGVEQHQLSYNDAQIWAVAKLHQISTVLTEDFQSSQTLEGVRFADPFTEEIG